MGIPVWGTVGGNLGTIQEGEYYELTLEATDPSGDNVTFEIIAGYLPPGLVLDTIGVLSGRPRAEFQVTGTPVDVDQDITSTFVCRATSASTSQITDRTFSLTVTGQDAPVITNTTTLLASVLDGTWVSVQLDAIDLDPYDTLTWDLVDGSLPPGLSLDSTTGVISGYAMPTANSVADATVGWSATSGWEEYPWDHGTTWVSQGYQFTVEVTDGKEIDQMEFSIFVYAKSLLTADNTTITADDLSDITADHNEKHTPAILTRAADLGIFAHDNYFAYRFTAIDFDQEPVSFGITDGDGNGFDSILDSGFDSSVFDQGDLSLPPGLTMNSETGWLYGYLGRQIASQTEYTFAVYAYKTADPTIRSDLVYFTITIVGDYANAIVWNTPSDLGTIDTGEISELYVQASNQYGLKLNYSLVSGSALPQGLKLLESGLLVGRPSFELTTFDNDTTTFDQNARRFGAQLSEMKFDRVFTFTVLAQSNNGELSSRKTFTIEVEQSDFEPYESLYLKASPGFSSKEVFFSYVNNTDVIPSNAIYRNDDPYFGRAKDIRMLLVSGLRASVASSYISAMQLNHYRKTITIGDVKVAKAYDDNRNVVYEVLYFDLNDDQANYLGESTSKRVDLSSEITRSTTLDNVSETIDENVITIDGAGNKIVYPNSFANMRTQLKSTIGTDIREPLPKWMQNRQADGSIIRWKPMAVLAYLKPGYGSQVLFNINRLLQAIDPKTITYEVDRYIWDRNLSAVYDPSTGEYLPSVETTFDAEQDWSSAEPSATVQFAVSVPFNHLDGRTTEYIDDTIGGLDGIVTSYAGMKIIFAQQEQYSGFSEPSDGWIRNNTFWDDSYGWDNSNSTGWDDYEIINGYTASLDGSTQNQRSAVWQFVQDEQDAELWRLEFVQEIELGETVLVENGATYGGYLCVYGPLIDYSEGDTVPEYNKVEEVKFTDSTTFDNDTTRFVNNVTVYEDPDVNDKYLAFPRKNIWA